jgi:putative spermidine/putrescine transport system ATP-binding protein
MRIELHGLTKRFGGTLAVDGLSLDIAQGELVSFVGGSGCGKTTTLRMIAGFERPDAGEVRFDGRRMNDVPPRRRDVGIVFQSYALFPTMTVIENIAFGLRVARWPETRVRDRVAEMVGLVHLRGLEARYANQLSGGQQQRVALARALARRPGILLLDEPLSALDAKIRQRLRAEVRKIQQDLGVTTIYVTHDQEEALSIADRIAVMRDGRIEQVGPPELVYGAPASDFVADFVGISNLFDCRIVDRDGLVEWEGEQFRVERVSGQPGEDITVALRPEKLRLLPGLTAGGTPNRLPGTVEVITFLGAIVRVEVSVRGRPLWVDVAHGEARALERKKPVLLAFEPADCVIVPRRNGGEA